MFITYEDITLKASEIQGLAVTGEYVIGTRKQSAQLRVLLTGQDWKTMWQFNEQVSLDNNYSETREAAFYKAQERARQAAQEVTNQMIEALTPKSRFQK